MAKGHSAETGVAGKSAHPPTVRKVPTPVPSVKSVMRQVQLALGTKAAAKLALITGASIDACEKWFSGKREPGAAFLFNMLRDELIGRIVVKAIVDGSSANWVREYSRHEQTLVLRRQIADSLRRLEEIQQADA